MLTIGTEIIKYLLRVLKIRMDILPIRNHLTNKLSQSNILFKVNIGENMKKRNLLVCIIILLSFLPIVVIAQLDINRLKTDKRGFGFGYRSYDTNEKIHGILASGDYGITESTKYSGQVNIIFSEEHYDSMIIDFRNQLIHSDSVQIPSDGLSGIDFGYFLLGGIDIAYLYFVQTTQEVTRLYYGEYYFESYG